jgi:aminoglycoside 2'-N-acetyltransferase I
MGKNIILTSAKTEELSADSRTTIIELCIAAHQNDDFRNLFTYVPAGGWHFLAKLDGQLVSHAMVTTRWLLPEGLPLLMTAYVDAVSTLPEAQGNGYASAVMRRLARDIDSTYVIACLETEIEKFYQSLGWETWRGPLAGRSEQGLLPTPDQRGIMILRLSQTPVLDLNTSLTIESQGGRIW